MKKLMIAAAAALCATVSVQALESAIVVGYNTATHRKAYTLVVPEFDKIGAEGLDIQTIVPDATTLASYPAGKITIQTFTAGAAASEVYYYFTAEESDEEENAGWYDNINGMGTPAVKTFAKGEGFMLYMPREGGTLTTSGEVSLDAKTIQFRKGYTLTGNFRPVSVGIQNLLVPSDAILESYPAGKVTLQTFTAGAAASEVYYYFTAEESDEEENAGWYNNINGMGIPATRSFAPGEGFMLYMPAIGNVTFSAVSAN